MSVQSESSLLYIFGLLQAHNPELAALLGARNQEDFVAAAEQGLARAIITIQSGATQYRDLDERGLSLLLADLLNHSGFSATAERRNNGHCDVVVEYLLPGRWRYLGECKLHRGPQYHIDGCEQLLGYCGGHEIRTFCLDFFKVKEMYNKLASLREHCDSQLPLSQRAVSKEDPSTKGAFVTQHPHSSGTSIEILHVGCNVFIEDQPAT